MYGENQCIPPTEQDFSGTATVIATTTNASWGTFGKRHSAPPVDENSWLPGIHSQKHTQWKTLIQKDTCTPVFIVALFTIAKTLEQPKCPLTDKWIKKCNVCVLYIYIYMNVTQSLKNQRMSFAAIWIDLEIVSFLWDYQRNRGKQ